MNEPLSLQLARILREAPAADRFTLNDLLARTEGRGLYLLMILLCVPFVPMFTPPGLSGLLGGVIMVLCGYMLVGARPQLPRFIGARSLPAGLREQLLDFLAPDPARPRPRPTGFRQRLVSGSVRFLRFIERWSHPRGTPWMNWTIARIGHLLLIFVLAFLLALPLPSAPIFPTNPLPAYSIILVAAAVMEADGVLIWFGYALSLATIIFFISVAGMIVQFFETAGHGLRHLLGI